MSLSAEGGSRVRCAPDLSRWCRMRLSRYRRVGRRVTDGKCAVSPPLSWSMGDGTDCSVRLHPVQSVPSLGGGVPARSPVARRASSRYHVAHSTCNRLFARFGPSGTILDRAGPGSEVASLLQRLPAFFAVFRPSLKEIWAVFRTPISMAFTSISKTNSRIAKTRLRGVTTVRPAIGPVRPVR